MVNSSQKKTFQNKNSRNVALKPRSGVFKHESDLFALFVAEMTAILFFPEGCYDARAPQGGSHEDNVVWELFKQYCQLSTELHHELARKEKLKQAMSSLSIDKMNADQLLELKASLERLQQQVQKEREERFGITPTPSSSGDMCSTEDATTSLKN